MKTQPTSTNTSKAKEIVEAATKQGTKGAAEKVEGAKGQAVIPGTAKVRRAAGQVAGKAAEKIPPVLGSVKDFMVAPDNRGEAIAAVVAVSGLAAASVAGVVAATDFSLGDASEAAGVGAVSLECRTVEADGKSALKTAEISSEAYADALADVEERTQNAKRNVRSDVQTPQATVDALCEDQAALAAAIHRGMGWLETQAPQQDAPVNATQQLMERLEAPPREREANASVVLPEVQANIAETKELLGESITIIAKDDDHDARVNPTLRQESLEALRGKAAALHGSGDAWVAAVGALKEAVQVLDEDLRYLQQYPSLYREKGLKDLYPDAQQSLLKEYDALLRAGAPTWNADFPAKGGKLEPTPMHTEVANRVANGASFKEIQKLEKTYRESDAFISLHLAEAVSSRYDRLVPDHRQGEGEGKALAEELMAKGVAPKEILAAVDEQIRSSKAYRLQTLSTNRIAWYFEQPYTWTCAPSSSVQALTAIGKGTATMQLHDELVVELGVTPDRGLWGDGSLIAAALNQREGVGAEFIPSNSVAQMRAALEDGYGIIVNGSIDRRGGHFVYINSIDKDGNFVMGDPFGPRSVPRWTEADLRYFVGDDTLEPRPVNPDGFVKVWRKD